ARQHRLERLAAVLTLIMLWVWLRLLRGHSLLPHITLTPGLAQVLPMLLLVVILGGAVLLPLLLAGRSPHVLFRPSEIPVALDDVKGMPVVVDEVVKTLNLFLAHKTFEERMGGTARRAILFVGPPGTGKTYMAKAMAKEAAVPVLFVSSSPFQSM